MLQARKETSHETGFAFAVPPCFSALRCYTEAGVLIICFSYRHDKKGTASMVKQQIIRLVAGPALLLALLAGMALGFGAHAFHASSAVSAPATHHILSDVDPFPPGH